MTTSTELIKIETITPAKVFTEAGGLQPVLDMITKEAKSVVTDPSTEKGRKEIASLAYKVARTKTTLDDLGAALTEDMKKQVKVVDASRKVAREYLDKLKDEIRKPLDDYENAQKGRSIGFERKIMAIMDLGKSIVQGYEINLGAMKSNRDALESMHLDETWAEFRERAVREHGIALNSITAAIAKKEKDEADKAELARLRKEDEERKAKERDEAIAKEAADKAKREAEEAAQAERDRVAAAEREQQAKLEAEQKAKKDAEDNARKAQEALEQEKERSRLAAEKAEKDKKDAADKAAADERARIERQRQAEENARIARERDLEHKRKINLAIVDALVTKADISEDTAKLIVSLIAKKEVPHASISY